MFRGLPHLGKLAENLIPQVYPDKCVYSFLASASCERCIDVCPTQAWEFEDDELTLIQDDCINCALCARVCPEKALGFALKVPIRSIRHKDVAFISCVKSGTTVTVPCKHAVDLEIIAKLYTKGVRALLVAETNCADCATITKTDQLFDSLIDNFNRMLQAETLPLLKLMVYPPSSYEKLHQTSSAQENRVGRRELFTAIIQQGKERLDKPDELQQFYQDNLKPDSSIYPFMPQININCTACNSCVNLCPHDALVLGEDSYNINPQNCTGCALCEDICEEDAVNVANWSQAERLEIELSPSKCKRCGVDFFSIESPTELCHICRKVNHHSNLYQTF